MATVNGWHGPFTISVGKLIELLKQSPPEASVIVNAGHLSIVELQEIWFNSKPVGLIDLTTETFEQDLDRKE